MRIVLLITLLMVVYADISAEVTVTPTLNVSLSGGGFYFADEPLSFGGYADIDAVPIFSFNENSMFLLGYSGKYRGMKDIVDFTGGMAFYEEYMNHLLFLKYVYTLRPGLKLKPVFNYKQEMYKETRDQPWENGLYNYERNNGGVEIEKTYDIDPFSWFDKYFVMGAGYDTGTTIYTNPETISDLFEILGSTEYATGGPDLFNYRADAVYAKGDLMLEKINARFDYVSTRKNYDGQNVIDNTGSSTAAMRKDDINNIMLEAGWFLSSNTALILEYKTTLYISNQNHYDGPQGGTYIAGFYNYTETTLSPAISIRSGKTTLSLAFDNGTRDYETRPSQDANGTYLADSIITQSSNISFKIANTLQNSLVLSVSINAGTVSSNTLYEEVYRYNYNNFNFLVGLSYRYP